MSKIREDYENTRWRRFERFVNGEEMPEEKRRELTQVKEYDQEEQLAEITTTQSLRRRKKEERESFRRYWREQQEKEIKEALKQRADWPNTGGVRVFRCVYGFVALLICAAIIIVLLETVAELPRFGSAETPANSNEVAERYIEKGQEETGAVNIVTGMILDYRAFDTLGESHVLFIAACTVLILLRIDHGKDGKPTSAQLAEEEDDRKFEPKNDKILQKVAFFLVPCIILFGIYVILNGHISPGGGFSGGAIIGAGLILYLNAFGFKKTERFFTYKTFSTISLCALLFYSVAKCYSFFCGANHLNSGIPLGTAGDIISSGLILPLNICVGCVVACTMYAFYAIFRKGGI